MQMIYPLLLLIILIIILILLLVRSQQQVAKLQKEYHDIAAQQASLQAENKYLNQQLAEQKENFLQQEEKLRIEFENLANDLLDRKSAKFTEQNQTNLEQLLKPFQEKIKEFEKKVEDTYNQEARERFSLQKEVNRLFELNQTLSNEANQLVKALKTDTKKQGNWGEMILEKVLEISGLQKGVHYILQGSVQDETGKQWRPDAVIMLPDNRHIVIDAKVSLTAYNHFHESTTVEEQQSAVKAHLQSVRAHINGLSDRNYEKLFDNAPDFVIMFIPVEPAYSLALQQDSSLYEEAFRKKIILVSVSTLLASLRMIEAMWRLDKQNKNAADIVKQGNDLYDKLVNFVNDLQDIGKNIGRAQQSYEDAMNKLSKGKGNLLSRANRMKQLGLDPKKQLPLVGEEEDET